MQLSGTYLDRPPLSEMAVLRARFVALVLAWGSTLCDFVGQAVEANTRAAELISKAKFVIFRVVNFIVLQICRY